MQYPHKAQSIRTLEGSFFYITIKQVDFATYSRSGHFGRQSQHAGFLAIFQKSINIIKAFQDKYISSFSIP